MDNTVGSHASLGASGSQLQSALLYLQDLRRHMVKETWPPIQVKMPAIFHLIQEDLYQKSSWPKWLACMMLPWCLDIDPHMLGLVELNDLPESVC